MHTTRIRPLPRADLAGHVAQDLRQLDFEGFERPRRRLSGGKPRLARPRACVHLGEFECNVSRVSEVGNVAGLVASEGPANPALESVQ